METINFLMDAWATDPVPLILAAVFTLWLWNTDPDVVMWIAIGCAIWWLFA